MRLPELKPESDQFLHLDVLRFLAAAGVVLHHYRNQWTWNGVEGVQHPFYDKLSLLVGLFFIISGVLITAVYENRLSVLDFLKKRIARLYPLHLATLGFFVLVGVYYAVSGARPDAPAYYDPRCILPNLLMIQAWGVCHSLTYNHVSWSISAEMFVYLLFPLFLRLLRVHRALPAVMAVGLLALFVALGKAGPQHAEFHEWTWGFGMLRAVPPFLAGMSMWAYRAEIGRLRHARWWLRGGCLLFVALAAWESTPRLALVPMVYAIAVAAVAADQQRQPSRMVRLIAPLGILTYSIYMLHPAVRTIGLKVGEVLHLPLNLTIALCGAALLPIGYASYILFERPARRWINGFGGRRAAAARSEPVTW